MKMRGVITGVVLIVVFLLTGIDVGARVICSGDQDRIDCYDYSSKEHTDYTRTGDVWSGYNHSTHEWTEIEIDTTIGEGNGNTEDTE